MFVKQKFVGCGGSSGSGGGAGGGDQQQSSESPGKVDKESGSTTSILPKVSSQSAASEQDEKLLKLASELLLSDEDSLKSLSAQLLNEAKHLTQLNCVLAALNKIRAKYVKQAANGCLERLSAVDVDALVDTDASNAQLALPNAFATDSSNINYILEVIQDIFVQHKLQISEQLNEVRKLMSISSDDDLISHLQ